MRFQIHLLTYNTTYYKSEIGQYKFDFLYLINE